MFPLQRVLRSVLGCRRVLPRVLQKVLQVVTEIFLKTSLNVS